MEADGRVNRNETADCLATLEAVDHVRERRIGQSIAVIGEEHFIILDEMSDRHETLADIAPDASVYERDAPVRRSFTQISTLLPKSEIMQSPLVAGL